MYNGNPRGERPGEHIPPRRRTQGGNYSGITREELAKECGISSDGIRWQLKQLKGAGLIRRVGPDNGGH
ncbi:MAG: winged helix-turn-helix transcriptional regulator [Treponema sp.]|nr:winged helix-turn-helix transcriptional regulator [Treponema sp.]